MRKVLRISCRAFVLSLGVAIIMQLGATHPVQADPASDKAIADKVLAELTATGSEYLAAYNRHDTPALASFSTEKSELIKWSGEIVHGKADIQKFFERTFKENPNLHMESELESAHMVSADAVMTYGTLKFTGNSQSWPSVGKFAVLWQKVDGKWKALFDAGFTTTATAR
jgi:ketosteroid isomerase-like protein